MFDGQAAAGADLHFITKGDLEAEPGWNGKALTGVEDEVLLDSRDNVKAAGAGSHLCREGQASAVRETLDAD